MVGYFLRRILFIIPTVLIVILAVILLLGAYPPSVPGGAAGPGASAAEDAGSFLHALRSWQQWIFGSNAAGRPRTGMAYILPRFLGVFRLTGISVFFSLLLGVPAGIVSAIYQDRWQDHALSIATVFVSAFPAFCLSLAVILVFALKLHWFHVIQSDPRDYVMPVLALSLSGIATVCRMTRSSMLEVLDKQYITALRSLGISRRSVIFKHAFRNALVPIASALSLLIGQLLFSAIVVERFFNLPGGTLISDLSNHNSADLISIAVVLAIFMCLLNILADAVFLLVNPAIRSSFLGRRAGVRSIRKERGK